MAKSANAVAFNLGDIIKELFTFREEPGAKPVPLWAFIAAAAADFIAWIILFFVGAGFIALIPMLLAGAAVVVSVLVIRPAHGLWKYLTLASLTTFAWSILWIILGIF